MDNDSISERLLTEEHKLFPVPHQNCWAPDPLQVLPAPHLNLQHQAHSLQKKPKQRLNPTQKVPRRSKKNEQQLAAMNKGHWSLEENKKYHWFLQLYYKHFVNSHMRRTDKIFKTMEQFIGTRQAEQCRSHHQKMQKKYTKFTVILMNLREAHYQTMDTAPIRHELEQLGIPMPEDLPSLQQLAQMAQIQNQSEAKVKRRPAKKVSPDAHTMPMPPTMLIPSCGLIQDREEQKEQPHEFNMFEECQNHNIGEISLHLKEDSCPFQSIFHQNQ